MELRFDTLDGYVSPLVRFCNEFTLPPHTVIAGGSVRDHINGREPNDIDIFVLRQGDITGVCDLLTSRVGGFNFKHNSYPESLVEGMVTALGVKVQIIKSPTDNPEQLLAGFDLSCAQVYTDGQDVMGPEYAFQDIREHRMRFNVLKEDSLKVLARFQRYVSYGFSAQPEDIAILHKWIKAPDTIAGMDKTYRNESLLAKLHEYFRKTQTASQPTADYGVPYFEENLCNF